MINNVVLVGRLTRDPELKYTSSNVPVVTFTLAVNRSFKNEAGETEADFIQCVAWRNQAENLQKFMSKGSQIGVEGRVATRSYETQDGTRYVTEIVANQITFLESKKQEEAPQPTEQPREDVYPETKPSDHNPF